MAVAGESHHLQPQGLELLNCPSLSGLSVQTEASIENTYQKPPNEGQDDRHASPNVKHEQTQILDEWNSFAFEDTLLPNRQSGTCDSHLDPSSVLYVDSQQPQDSWKTTSAATFHNLEITRGDESSNDGALKHVDVSQAYNLDYTSHAHYGNQAQSELSSAMDLSAKGTIDTENTQKHRDCRDNIGVQANGFLSQSVASEEIGENLQWWQTSNPTRYIATNGSISSNLQIVPSANWDPPLSESPRIGNEAELGEQLFVDDRPNHTPEIMWPQSGNSSGNDESYSNIQDMIIWGGENTSEALQDIRPYAINSDSIPLGSIVVPRLSSKDDFLVQQKRAGLTYKEIKIKGHFAEAESTLRGRYRNLTKRKEERVRRPEWEDRDVSPRSRSANPLY